MQDCHKLNLLKKKKAVSVKLNKAKCNKMTIEVCLYSSGIHQKLARDPEQERLGHRRRHWEGLKCQHKVAMPTCHWSIFPWKAELEVFNSLVREGPGWQDRVSLQ